MALRRAWKQHRDVTWLVDNSAVLASVVRGKSKCESMDVVAENTQLVLMRDRVRVCIEYVESIANWSDGNVPGGSKTAPHLIFFPSVVWSSVGIGHNQKSNALTAERQNQVWRASCASSTAGSPSPTPELSAIFIFFCFELFEFVVCGQKFVLSRCLSELCSCASFW